MNQPTLSFIMIRTMQMDAALTFYRSIGLDFREERHGSGPIHYAAILSNTVIEIYPATGEPAADAESGNAIMLGIAVPSLEEALADLELLGVRPSSPPREASRGHFVVVRDPDGRAVNLSEPVK